MISTHCIGYDHIDIAYVKKAKMTVSHITYDSESVAEYTVMMMLMATKRMTLMLEKLKRSDFTTKRLIRGELKEMTVEIIGTGGSAVPCSETYLASDAGSCTATGTTIWRQTDTRNTLSRTTF